MSNPPNLCDPKRCVGCGACRAKCPTDAISTPLDDEGFFAPKIDASQCVECRLCETVCPVSNPPRLARSETPDVFACWNNDDEARSLSSSGGMFSVFATKIVERGGVVFGVAFDDRMRAAFVRAETVADLKALRSSKYVQADSGAVYRDVETELERNRPVLFAGTPCQLAGLYSFLGKEFANLSTCDVVCRGVPSPRLFEKWLRFLEETFGGRIFALNFRDKSQGGSHSVAITVGSPNATPIVFPWRDFRASYVDKAFIANIGLRASCSDCPFKFPRVGDVSLGDFWGLGKKTPFPFVDELAQGVSLVLINDEQGRRLAATRRESATWIERDLDEAKAGNPHLTRSVVPNAKRSAFLRDLQTLNYETLIKKYRRELSETPLRRFARRLRQTVRAVFSFRFYRSFRSFFSFPPFSSRPSSSPTKKSQQ